MASNHPTNGRHNHSAGMLPPAEASVQPLANPTPAVPTNTTANLPLSNWDTWLRLLHTVALGFITAALALWIMPGLSMVWSEAAAVKARNEAEDQRLDGVRRRSVQLEAERLRLAEENARLARELNRTLKEK